MADDRIAIDLYGRDLLTGPINQAIGSLKSLGKMADQVSSAVKLIFGGSVLASTVKAIADYQSLSSRFQALSGSSAEFAANQAYISTTSQRMALDLDSSREGFAKLLAMEQAGVLTHQNAIDLFEGLARAQKVLGVTSDQMGYVFYGLGQALAEPVLKMQDLRQVTDPMPGLLNKMDQAAQLPAGGFRKMTGDAVVANTVFRDVLIRALQDYALNANQAADRVGPAFTRLKNSIQLLQESFAGPGGTAMTSVMNTLQAGIEAVRREIASGLDTDKLIASMDLWKAAGVNSVNSIVQALGTLTGTSALVTKALGTDWSGVGGIIKDAFFEFPANFSFAATWVMAEADQLWTRLKNGAQIVGLRLQNDFIQFGLTVNRVWTDIKIGWGAVEDWVDRRMASGVEGMRRALQVTPTTSGGFIDTLEGVSESLKRNATNADAAITEWNALDAIQKANNKTLQEQIQILQTQTTMQVAASNTAVATAYAARNASVAMYEAKVQELQANRAQAAAAQQAAIQAIAASKSTATALQQEQAVSEKLLKVREDMAKVTLDTNSQIMEINRKGMSEAEKQASLFDEAVTLTATATLKLQQINATTSDAIRQQTQAEADAMAKRASQLANQITNTELAKSVAEDAGAVQQKILQQQADLAAKPPIQIKADNKPAIDNILKITDGFTDVTKAVKDNPITIDIDTQPAVAKLNALQQQIQGLAGGTSLTIDVTGGSAPGMARGGWLPGYGGGDRIHALLEAGEYVVNKTAVRRFGRGLFDALNQPLVPPTRSAPASYASGGIIPGQEVVTLNINLGGTPYHLYGARQQVKGFADALTRLAVAS